MVQGRKPDYEKRKQARRLHQEGLSTTKIGKIMGVEAGAVTAMLARSRGGPILNAWIRCRRCDADIAKLSLRSGSWPVLCLACLKKQKRPLFRERLLAYRLSKGLTPIELAKKVETSPGVIALWERGVSSPRWETVVKLVQVLGQGLVTEPPL
jgi:DNA-binding XRE family transcriptional regulator